MSIATIPISSTSANASASAPLRAAEFFAGIGLVRLAIERHGWRVVFANDIDPMKLAMYKANFGDDHFHLGDIHAIDPKSIPAVDLFTASFPCNDLSIAGAWDGLAGKESSAFWGLISILKNMPNPPPLVMLENVVGFLQIRGGADFETALLALNELGYGVDAFILNAQRWTPQSRARLFIVAQRRNSVASKSAGPWLAMESDARPDALCRFINTHPNLRWQLRDLPPLPAAGPDLTTILQDLPDDDEHWWNAERSEYFFGQLSQLHLALARQMMAAPTPGYATAFRRVRNGKSMAELRADGIAGCLRTPRGGSGRQILFKAGAGRYQVRLLTARECARLQGVPDHFVIDASLTNALFGFGDAVCVPTVAWIAEHYLTPLARELGCGAPSISNL